MSDYLKTRTGRLYWAEPERYAFTIQEIAESLSRICRFNGHMGWESVATHSIRVARAVGHMPPRVQLAALLHDAHEAYIGDIPGPLLRAGLAGPLVMVGAAIQAAIIAQLAPMCRGLSCAEVEAIASADRADCARTLELGPPDREWPWPGHLPGREGEADRFAALYGQLARECASSIERRCTSCGRAIADGEDCDHVRTMSRNFVRGRIGAPSSEITGMTAGVVSDAWTCAECALDAARERARMWGCSHVPACETPEACGTLGARMGAAVLPLPDGGAQKTGADD